LRSEGEGEDLYIRAAELHPDIVFHHYNERHDAVQAMFMQLIGEKRPDVPAKLDQAHAYIRARVPNFRTYTSGGHDEAIIGGYYDAVLAKNALDNRGRSAGSVLHASDQRRAIPRLVYCGRCGQAGGRRGLFGLRNP
jgi:hypothetical protein